GLLARIDRDDRGRHAAVAPIRAVVAHRIAAVRRLDLDDLGTEEAQQMRRVRSRHHMAEIRDADAFERARHSPASAQRTLPSDTMLARAVASTDMPSIP